MPARIPPVLARLLSLADRGGGACAVRPSPSFDRSRGCCCPTAGSWWLAGFLGMFLCGGPVYIAGVSTTAINIALIMSLSPVVVLVISWLSGLEGIGPLSADRHRASLWPARC